MRELIIRLAKENVCWGLRRIVGELKKLALKPGRSTVRRVLNASLTIGIPNPPTANIFTNAAKISIVNSTLEFHLTGILAGTFQATNSTPPAHNTRSPVNISSIKLT